MIAGMTEVIKAHAYSHAEFAEDPACGWMDFAVCVCGIKLHHADGTIEPNERDDLHSAHLAKELADAGYGLLPGDSGGTKQFYFEPTLTGPTPPLTEISIDTSKLETK